MNCQTETRLASTAKIQFVLVYHVRHKVNINMPYLLIFVLCNHCASLKGIY